MRSYWISTTIALLVTGIAWGGNHDQHAVPAGAVDPRFEFLKRLEGTWVGRGLDDSQPGVYEFRVTAGGTAVEEREMVGTPMEMVTLYVMQGADLMATHYCMLGNQPRLKAQTIVESTLSFACTGTPGNAKSHDEHHVHAWSMRLDDSDRLHYAAELREDGQITETPTVVLTRQPRTASR